jgi:acetyl-CoA acyltransferase
MTTRPVIAGYVRSPFQSARKGELVDVRPDELCGQVVRALVERTGIERAQCVGGGQDIATLLESL